MCVCVCMYVCIQGNICTCKRANVNLKAHSLIHVNINNETYIRVCAMCVCVLPAFGKAAWG